MTENERNPELWNLFRKRETALRVLRSRGYELPKGVEDLPFEDFEELHRKNRHHLYFPNIYPPEGKMDGRGGGIYVYFEHSEDFTKRILEARESQISQEYKNLDRLFFVLKTGGKSKKKINTFVTSTLTKNPKFAYVRILENIYSFDIVDNFLVPEYRLLTDQEKEAVLKYYNITLDKCPKQSDTDAISKRFGAKIDDMFYIKRRGGREIEYRVVIKDGTC
jgi:DNA-directed RNA polymerase subunit H (RpoH/RPB5)